MQPAVVRCLQRREGSSQENLCAEILGVSGSLSPLEYEGIQREVHGEMGYLATAQGL